MLPVYFWRFLANSLGQSVLFHSREAWIPRHLFRIAIYIEMFAKIFKFKSTIRLLLRFGKNIFSIFSYCNHLRFTSIAALAASGIHLPDKYLRRSYYHSKMSSWTLQYLPGLKWPYFLCLLTSELEHSQKICEPEKELNLVIRYFFLNF